MNEPVWWQHGIIYQIYPRSFQDTARATEPGALSTPAFDGIGDLAGIASRLDHLVHLGVDALWISPFYPSPMADFGYDVADYCDVDPIFGTLDDFDRLAAAAHARDLKVIVDFVPNHTSDRHRWFEASRASREDPKRDWYLWRDPAPDGGPPNNWMSNFGGPAWTFDAATGQYYCHSFLPAQPDLNWRNPDVRAAMYEVLRFWLRRGVDGFRIDVVYHLIKDDAFRDNPANPDYRPGAPSWHRILPLYTADRPEVQDILVEMRAVAAEFDTPGHEHVLIGELYLPLARIVAYYGADADGRLRGVQLPFNFQLISAPWNAPAIDRIIRDYEAALPPQGWPNWVLGNHDQSRIASRVGRAQAKIAAMLLLTLRGTPTLYYGDEIGMHDVAIPVDEVQDPLEKNEPGKGLGRDPQRTPMQWDATANAGFSGVRPWLRVADDYPDVNIARQDADPASMFALTRTLAALRRSHPALAQGSYEAVHCDDAVLAFRRFVGPSQVFVALNFTSHDVPMPSALRAAPGVLLSTRLDREAGAAVEAVLRADEGIIVG
jgi:alpha-glucosidase